MTIFKDLDLQVRKEKLILTGTDPYKSRFMDVLVGGLH